jgi:hypothetical protein
MPQTAALHALGASSSALSVVGRGRACSRSPSFAFGASQELPIHIGASGTGPIGRGSLSRSSLVIRLLLILCSTLQTSEALPRGGRCPASLPFRSTSPYRKESGTERLPEGTLEQSLGALAFHLERLSHSELAPPFRTVPRSDGTVERISKIASCRSTHFRRCVRCLASGIREFPLLKVLLHELGFRIS